MGTTLGLLVFVVLGLLVRGRRRRRKENRAGKRDLEALRRSLPPRPTWVQAFKDGDESPAADAAEDVESGLLGAAGEGVVGEDLVKLNQRLDAVLANDVAIEGWLNLTGGMDSAVDKSWSPGLYYFVLWSVDAELRFYESMAPSSFGNVHISEKGAVSVARILSVEAAGLSFSLEEQRSVCAAHQRPPQARQRRKRPVGLGRPPIAHP